MKISDELKSLIYQHSNTIITQSDTVEGIAREIEAVKSGSKLEGFIFRPGFAESCEFSSYTAEDWYAIYAQWSVCFGWAHIFEEITDENPEAVLDGYLGGISKEKLSSVHSEPNAPMIAREDRILDIAKAMLDSNAILTPQQHDILSKIPLEAVKEAYKESRMPIRETRTKVLARLLEEDKSFNPFRNIEDIPSVLAETFSTKGTFSGDITDRESLKRVRLRLPRSMKRKVLDTLAEGHKRKGAKANFKKYQEFWKKILKSSMIDNSFDKTATQYPDFAEIHALIHSRIKTTNTEIERLRKSGMLAEAFELELLNPGQMLRNLSFYLRQPKGSVYPTKAENYAGKKSESKKTRVKTDIEELLQNGKMAEAIKGANPKLLSHAKSILKNPWLSVGGATQKRMHKKIVRYERPAGAASEEWIDAALEIVESEYRAGRTAENRKLGKVFVSERLKGIGVLHSGRMDTGKTKSGKYLPVGSKIKLDLGEGKLIRYGVSWMPREENSISLCIDPSITIMDGGKYGQIVNWQNPEMGRIASSSGDVTSCRTGIWSTELMDIDPNELLRAGSTRFYTAVINYDNPRGSLADVQCHVFFNVIDKEERLIDGRVISIPLDEMEHSYEITENTPAEIGLLFDIAKGECEVLKIPVGGARRNETAQSMKQTFDTLISTKPEAAFAFEEIMACIEEAQIAKTKEEADLVLDENTEATVLQSILF